MISLKAYLVVIALTFGCLSSQAQPAQLQLIHNAADPAAFVVDIYVNEVLKADDLSFRTATAFLEVIANQDNAISLAFKESTSVYDAFATFLVRVPAGKHLAVFSGVYQPTDFAPNPDTSAPPILFTLFPIKSRRDTATSASNVDLFVFNGVTDAPALNIAAGTTTVASNLVYGSHADYTSLSSSTDAVINVTNSNADLIGQFSLDATARAGRALTIVCSGFLRPAMNQDGPSFGLWEAPPLGGPLLPLDPVVSSVDESREIPAVLIAPNPASSIVRFNISSSEHGVVILDQIGSIVATVPVDATTNACMIDTSMLPAGVYVVSARAGSAMLHIVR